MIEEGIGPEYDGRVQVGGPRQDRVLPGLQITKIAVGPYDNNAYLLRCRTTGEGLLIDAAAEPGRLIAEIGDAGISTVVTTHAHPDHWQALGEVVEATGARTMAGRLDAPEIPVVTDALLDHGDEVRVGAARLSVVHLQGHTPGSVVLVYADPTGEAHLFTGDCLFPGGVGKTWDDPVRFDSLLTGVQRHLFDVLGDDSWVYPGHGDDTTLGAERPHLAEWRARGW